jgi:hypothetical protein
MSNKQIQQTTSVADAEQAVARLAGKRNELLARGTELATIRASVAYKALNDGDAAARSALDRVNKETSELGAEVASLDAAMVTARQKLEAAQQYEAKAAERAKAAELRMAVKRFVKHAAGVDSALEVLISSCNGLQEALNAMHRCGSSFPSDAQLQSMGGRVLLGALGKTPFRRNFETLPPLERDRSMARIAEQWSATVERSVKQRLGEQTTEVA